MRAATISLFALPLLIGCAEPGPDNAILDRIEALLPQSPCVGSLDRWSRHYAFRRRGDIVNTGIVQIQLSEAGHRGIPAGRYVNSDIFDLIDDTQHRLAFGTYEVASGRIGEWMCGLNFPAGGAPGGFGPFPERP